MNRKFLGFFILLTMLLPCLSHGAGSPVVVTHTLTGYSKSADAVTLDYSLHIVNHGNLPLADLTLAHVPSPLFETERVTVTVGSLGPHGSADLAVRLVSPVIREQKRFSRSPLLWAGKYVDTHGNTVNFPTKSKAGGAK